jgi:hypothetical protein
MAYLANSERPLSGLAYVWWTPELSPWTSPDPYDTSDL